MHASETGPISSCLSVGGSLHLCMTPHGPDTTTYEAAIQDSNEQPKHLPDDTLAFMFETNYMPRITAAALGSPHVDRNYYKCWEGLKSHFDKNRQLAAGECQDP